MKKGIDVSHWQGFIDWGKVASSGIDFAIIKAGGSDDGFYTDSYFEANYVDAKAAGLHVGAYYFVGVNCNSKAAGEADARRFLEIIKGKTFDYPVYIDVEATKPSQEVGVTDATIAFCEVMENAGYFVGIYASDISGFISRLQLERLGAYAKWVAIYGSEPRQVKSYGIWQYSSAEKVNGINGNVDCNISYVDYSSIIKETGLNGYSKVTTNGNTKPITVVPQPTTPRQVPKAPAPHNFVVNDRVTVKNGAKTYTGGNVADFVYEKNGLTFLIDDLKGDRAVLQKSGINTPFNVKDLNFRNHEGTATTKPAEKPVVAKKTYTILPGDSFCGISKKIYKTEARAIDIAKANGMNLNSTIYAGKTLVIPQ